MLILTRKIGETIMIGDDVAITVTGIKGNQVRLGIQASASIPVHREEIYLMVKKESKQKIRLPNQADHSDYANLSINL